MPSLRVKYRARAEKAPHDAHPSTFMLVLINVSPPFTNAKSRIKKKTKTNTNYPEIVLKYSKGKFLSHSQILADW